MLSSYSSPWLLLIYLHFYDFVLSRMLYMRPFAVDSIHHGDLEIHLAYRAYW